MSKPTTPRDIKPIETNPENKNNTSKILIINVLTTSIICCLFLLANYFMQDSLLSQKIIHSQEQTDESVDNTKAAPEERGVIVDLGDFTMNLSDADSRRYLKASVALELTKKAEDDTPPKKGGHGDAPQLSPLEIEMAQYKPAIRDAVISALSSKTSAELSTIAGKELAKDEIIDSVDSIFGGDREVIRVSFGQFIMQ